MKTFLFCAFLLALSTGFAAMQPIDCPATLAVTSAASPPGDWQVVTPTGTRSLDRVGFYSGPPSEQVSLAPDSTVEGGGKSLDVWTFSPSTDEPLWVACFYAGTTLFIAKPVPRGMKRCSVSYATTRSGSRLRLAEAHCQ